MAIIKETTKSLKWFFIIVGLFSLYNGMTSDYTVLFKFAPLLGIASVISLIFGLITLYMGLKFESLLATRAQLIINFFWLQIGFGVVVTLYEFLIHLANILILVIFVIGLLIDLAIISNVKRLHKEATVPVPTPPV